MDKLYRCTTCDGRMDEESCTLAVIVTVATQTNEPIDEMFCSFDCVEQWAKKKARAVDVDLRALNRRGPR